jgi:hypothetical protein
MPLDASELAISCLLRTIVPRIRVSCDAQSVIPIVAKFPGLQYKSPIYSVLLYGMRNLSGADRSAPVFNTVIDDDYPLNKH